MWLLKRWHQLSHTAQQKFTTPRVAFWLLEEPPLLVVSRHSCAIGWAGALKKTPPLTLTGLALLSATVRRVAPSPRGWSLRTERQTLAGNWTRPAGAETDKSQCPCDDHVYKILINRYGTMTKWLLFNVKYLCAHILCTKAMQWMDWYSKCWLYMIFTNQSKTFNILTSDVFLSLDERSILRREEKRQGEPQSAPQRRSILDHHTLPSGSCTKAEP